uniref:Uncharacterized protein n=1 Tax=Anguilla anguilla TaxID=7936 RepID=A0A0E9PZ16_ANGAN
MQGFIKIKFSQNFLYTDTV